MHPAPPLPVPLVADIDILRTHALGLDGARTAATQVGDRLADEFGVDTRWEGDVLRVTGRGVDGTLDAGPETVHVRATLGLLARPFRRALAREIERELDLVAPPDPS